LTIIVVERGIGLSSRPRPLAAVLRPQCGLRLFARIVLLDLAVFFTWRSDLNRIGGHLSRRAPSQRSSQLEATGNITESVAEIGADEGKRSDGRDRDQGGD
jgi:hypothetical protein